MDFDVMKNKAKNDIEKKWNSLAFGVKFRIKKCYLPFFVQYI